MPPAFTRENTRLAHTLAYGVEHTTGQVLTPQNPKVEGRARSILSLYSGKEGMPMVIDAFIAARLKPGEVLVFE
jgi:hypothetical protein